MFTLVSLDRSTQIRVSNRSQLHNRFIRVPGSTNGDPTVRTCSNLVFYELYQIMKRGVHRESFAFEINREKEDGRTFAQSSTHSVRIKGMTAALAFVRARRLIGLDWIVRAHVRIIIFIRHI